VTVATLRDMIVQTETTLNLAEMERVEKEQKRLEAIEDQKVAAILASVEQTRNILRGNCELDEHQYKLSFGNVAPSAQYENGHVIVLNVHADDCLILQTETIVFAWGLSGGLRVASTSVVDVDGDRVTGLTEFRRALDRAEGGPA
jgi:hypothetical protein